MDVEWQRAFSLIRSEHGRRESVLRPKTARILNVYVLVENTLTVSSKLVVVSTDRIRVL